MRREINQFLSKNFGVKGSRTVISKLGQVISEYDIDLVLDVGANTGQFAKDISKVYSGDIISFEPAEVPFEALRRASTGRPNWQVRRLALGAEERRERLNISDRSDLNSFRTHNSFGRQFSRIDAAADVEAVDVVRGSEFIRDHNLTGRKILLKMDTQGYDLEVFAGFEDVLSSVCALMSEVAVIPLYDGMPHWLDSIASYERAGFSVVKLEPVTAIDDCVIEYDCIMKRRC